MTTPQWTVGMVVLTDPLRPTTITKITKTGIIHTADGRRFHPDGLLIFGAYAILRLDTTEDAAIRRRDKQANDLHRQMDDRHRKIQWMIRDLGRGFQRPPPEQSVLDRTERFLAAVNAWEAAEKERAK